MRVTLRTGLGVAMVLAGLGTLSSRPANAQVTIVQEPERPSLLYSADSDQDCSALNQLQGDALPYNVVRLRAVAPPEADGFQWSLPKPQFGFLLADQDLGPEETTAAVRGFCAEFGNACLLTQKALKFYNQPTVLYAAPTCDALPKDTRAPFAGRSVQIKVTVKAGKKKLGKGVSSVRFGSPEVASVTLYTIKPDDDGNLKAFDGHGQDSVEGFAITSFNAVETPADLPGLPAIASFDFEFAGNRDSEPICPDDPVAICSQLQTNSPGTFLSTVAVRLDDGSALCDALNINVGSCPRKAQVQIIRVPSKRTYTSGDAARLRVRFANLSPNRPGCSLALEGANVLTCSATFKLGKKSGEEAKSDQWDLQHCSATTSQPCTTTADCQCLACQDNEVCLTQSHCSETFTQLCALHGDADCEKPLCPTCKDNERCIRVLEVPQILVRPGQAVDLVDEVVTLKNEIRDPVTVKETWTANAFPGTSASAGIKYRIKGQ
jgi:hypothetical protein